MKKHLSIFLLLGVMLAVSTCPLHSGLKEKGQNIAPTFGGMFWDVTDKALDVESRSSYLGARYSLFINKRFGVEGTFGLIPSSNNEGTLDHNFFMLSGDGIFNLLTGDVMPYVVGGVGFMKNWVHEEQLPISDPYYEFGGGIKVFTIEDAWVGFDVRDVILSFEPEGGSSETYQNILATFNFGFQWGGGPPPDTDADGVPDKKDKCPDTPAGAIVDERGCPIDTDADGVYDGLDRCAGTPAGAVVDNSGCPKDSDGDGVFDGIDKCAGTPAGAVVDNSGCPKDGDGDGVYDGLDKCPDTPKEAKVDISGCEIPEIEYEFLSKEKLELYIQFKLGSAAIEEESEKILNGVGAILTKWDQVRVEIGGHTDSSGSESVNMKLSQKRAEAVRDYLLENFTEIDS
ncbi:MAG: OmpA family protein, partial [Candidatus Glassbacteria bacterium]